MKNLFIILAFFTLFSGCSKKNAFYEFKMDKDQELSVSNLKSSKITSKNDKKEIYGLFYAVYLNEIYPEIYNDKEYFFVYIFTKRSKELYDPKKPTNSDLNIKLNLKLPIKVEELPKENKFSHLINVKSEWNRYYLVTFEKTDTLDLVLEDKDSSSSILKYRKDQ